MMMMAAVLVSTIELAVVWVRELLKPPLMLLNLKEMLEVFGFFLMVLIGLELLETFWGSTTTASRNIHMEEWVAEINES